MKAKRAHQLIIEAWGTALRTARVEQGLTQNALAVATGISQPTISEIENGTYRRLDIEQSLKLCVALNRNPEQIFGWPVGIIAAARYELEAAAVA